MLYQEFYSEIGKLLYAVSHVDGVISKTEKEKLKELVRKELVPVESHRDAFGTDAAWFAEFEFDILEEEMVDAETAFESFLQFIEEHSSAISEEMLWAAHRVAGKLSSAYYHTNKNEKILLDKLEDKIHEMMKEQHRETADTNR